MTHISSVRLRMDVSESISNLFLETLISIKNKSELHNFFEGFLSHTESTVLAKRFAIVVLLEKGNTYDEICQILRVTPPTVLKVNTSLKYGNVSFAKIVKTIVDKDKTSATWESLLNLLDLPNKGSILVEWQTRKTKRKRKIRQLVKEI